MSTGACAGTVLPAAEAHYRQLADYRQACRLRDLIGGDRLALALKFARLADEYQDKERISEACFLYWLVFALREQSLPEGHPTLAASLVTLALVYQGAGQYALAEGLSCQALAWFEKSLGAMHPEMALSMYVLRQNYLCQGRLSDAEALNRRINACWKDALGACHPVFTRRLAEACS